MMDLSEEEAVDNDLESLPESNSNEGSDEVSGEESDEETDEESDQSSDRQSRKRKRDECSSASRPHSSKTHPKTFLDKWTEEQEFKGWLRPVPGKPDKMRCDACNTVLMCGKSEATKHAKGVNHQKNVRSFIQTPKINKAFKKVPEKKSKELCHIKSVKELEVRLAAFIADHNIAIQTADHLVDMLKDAIKDSKTVKDVKLHRTKCTKVIENVIAKTELEALAEDLRKYPFSILIDESTDVSVEKNMCVVVKYFHPPSGKVVTELLELINLDAKDCSAENMYASFKKTLAKMGIPVTKIVGMGTDNASVMTGKKNSFASRLLVDCPWAIIMNCLRHSSALASSHAASHIPSNVEQLLHNLSTYVSASAKRSAEFLEFQEFFQTERLKLLKPSKTRWLVLQKCVCRVLLFWNTRKAFFLTAVVEDKNSKMAKDIHYELENPYTKAYLLFMKYSLEYFNKFNALFQSEKVLIHKITTESNEILKMLGQNFLKEKALNEIETVNVNNANNLVPLEQVYLGPECEEHLLVIHPPDETDEGRKLLKQHLHTVRMKCLRFYMQATEELQKRLPVRQELLSDMEFVDPAVALCVEKRKTIKDLNRICTHFKRAPVMKDLDSVQLAFEWRTLPMVKDAEKLKTLEPPAFWKKVGSMTDIEGMPKFPNLCRLAYLCMSLPPSNADAERVFSLVTDIKNKKRNRMGEVCLNALCVIRSSFRSSGIDCVRFQVKETHFSKFNSEIYNT